LTFKGRGATRSVNRSLEERINNYLVLNNLEDKSDIKPIKEEMNKIIELDHKHEKRGLIS